MEFTFNIRREPATLLDKVCVIAKDRLIVSCNEDRGRFCGMFDGHYRVSGTRVEIHVRRKPLFVSWSMVKRGLDYLAA